MLADPVVIAVAGPLERRVVRVHLGDRELGRRIDARECLSVDDDVANHEPDFDVAGSDVQAVTRDGMAFPENDASRTFNPLGGVCHDLWLFGNRDHAALPAFCAEEVMVGRSGPDIDAFQAFDLQCGRRTTRGAEGVASDDGEIFDHRPCGPFCHLHDKHLKSERRAGRGRALPRFRSVSIRDAPVRTRRLRRIGIEGSYIATGRPLSFREGSALGRLTRQRQLIGVVVPELCDRVGVQVRSTSGGSASNSTCTSLPCRATNPGARLSVSLPGWGGSAYCCTCAAVSATRRTSTQQSVRAVKSRSMSSPLGSRSPPYSNMAGRPSFPTSAATSST